MHCELRPAFLERGFEFLDEQALASDLGQRSVEDLVAARGHAEQFDAESETAAQQVANVFCLPQREAAFPGGDDDV